MTPRIGGLSSSSRTRPAATSGVQASRQNAASAVNCTAMPGSAAVARAPTASASLTVMAHSAKYGASPRRPAAIANGSVMASAARSTSGWMRTSANPPAPSPDRRYAESNRVTQPTTNSPAAST